MIQCKTPKSIIGYKSITEKRIALELASDYVLRISANQSRTLLYRPLTRAFPLI